MADIKARYPDKRTGEDNDEWFTRWVAWFLALPDTPEYANWLRSGAGYLHYRNAAELWGIAFRAGV